MRIEFVQLWVLVTKTPSIGIDCRPHNFVLSVFFTVVLKGKLWGCIDFPKIFPVFMFKPLGQFELLIERQVVQLQMPLTDLCFLSYNNEVQHDYISNIIAN